MADENFEDVVLRLKDEATLPAKRAMGELQSAAQYLSRGDIAGSVFAVNNAINAQFDALAKLETGVERTADSNAKLAGSNNRVASSSKGTTEELTRYEKALKNVADAMEKRVAKEQEKTIKKASEVQRAFNEFSQGVQYGSQLVTTSLEKQAQAFVRLGGDIVKQVASGNMLSAALQLAATAWGYFGEKSRQAAAESEKAMKEALKVAEDSAKTMESVSKKSADEREKAEDDVARASIEAETLKAQAQGASLTVQEAQERASRSRRLKLLEEEVKLRQEAYASSATTAANTTAKSDDERKYLDQAAAAAKVALENTRARVEKEKELLAIQDITVKVRDQIAYQKELTAEAVKQSKEAADFFTKKEQSAEGDRKDLAARARLLTLTEDQKKSLSDMLKIDGLRSNSREAEAKALEAIVGAEQAREKFVKARTELEKAKTDEEARLKRVNDELSKQTVEFEYQQKLKETSSKVERVILEQKTKYVALLKQGADFETTRVLYEKETRALLKDIVAEHKKIASEIERESSGISGQLAYLSSHQRSVEAIDSVRRRGFELAAAAQVQALERLERERQLQELIARQQQEMAEAVKSQNVYAIQALEKKHALEQQLLKSQREQLSVTKELAAAGKSVSDDGRRTDYGIKARRDARRKELREKNLVTEQRGRGSFGSPEGSTYGPYGAFGVAEEGAQWYTPKSKGGIGGKGKPLPPEPGLPGLGEPPGKPKFDLGEMPLPVLPGFSGSQGPAAAAQSVAESAEKQAKEMTATAESLVAAAKASTDAAGKAEQMAKATTELDSASGKLAAGLDTSATKIGAVLDKVADIAESASGSVRVLIDKVNETSSRLDKVQREQDEWRKRL